MAAEPDSWSHYEREQQQRQASSSSSVGGGGASSWFASSTSIPSWHETPTASARSTANTFTPVEEGCCDRLFRLCVGTIHVVDGLVGLLLILYGVVLAARMKKVANDKERPVGAMMYCFLVGTVFVTSALFSWGGIRWSSCRRVGLVVGAFTALGLATVHLWSILLVTILFKGTFVWQYLRHHQMPMVGTDTFVSMCKSSTSFITLCLGVAAGLELWRFFLLPRLRRLLLEEDSESAISAARTARLQALEQWDAERVQPLLSLQDRRERGLAFPPATISTFNSDSNFQSTSGASASKLRERRSSSWFPSWGGRRKDAADAAAVATTSTTASGASASAGSDTGTDDFAPVDESIHFETPAALDAALRRDEEKQDDDDAPSNNKKDSNDDLPDWAA